MSQAATGSRPATALGAPAAAEGAESTVVEYTFVSVNIPEPRLVQVNARDYRLVPEKKAFLDVNEDAEANEMVKRFFDGKVRVPCTCG